MKKINYLVLMAALMLAGTNAWAATITLGNKSLDASATYDHLGDAFKNAKDGDVIKLVTNLDDANQSWFGEKSATGSSRSITLDLNGKTFTYTGSKGVAIPVTRGKLEITSTSGVGTMTTAVKTDLIRVYGTYQKIDAKNSTPFAHLVVKENVQLVCTNDGANAVTVDVMRNDATQRGAMGVSAAKDYPLDYACNFYQKISGSGHGVANGVRLDIYGTLISKKYAIKVNGCIRLGKEFLDGAGNPITTKSGKPVANPYYDSIKSPLTYYEPKRSGGSYTITENDGDYSPYVFIASSARLVTNNYESTSSIAAYSSGYARWQIEGYCEGSTGVYVKSGEVVLNNAEVKSNYTGDYVPAGQEGVDRASGVDAAGSGIVMESSANYSGNIDVTVQGDTKVEGSTGYAIDEVVTTAADETKVDALTITGGTFGTGAEGQGAIKVTETTAIAAADPEQTTTITISGGSIEEVDSEDNKIGDQTLADYLSDSEDTHVTIVENSDGSTTLVVSEGAEESVNYATIKGHEDGASVNWKRTGGSTASMSETIDENVNLSELVINQTKYDQTVTIADGYTLSVGRVILGGRAKIIVKAGGKFIVTGNQGIVSSTTDNIVLETEAGKPSIFLFNPAVSSNRHPHATVQFKSTKSFRVDDSNKQWERFGLPTWKAITSISCDQPELNTAIAIFGTSGWENCGILVDDELSGMAKLNKPFISCELLANKATVANATYTFTGELTGNMNADLNVDHEWTPFANSYSANVDAAAFIQGLQSGVNVDKFIYLAVSQGNNKFTWDPFDLRWEPNKQLAPMEAFILHNHGNVAENSSINYKTMVYDPATSGAGVPRRAIANDHTAKLRVVVEDAQGEWDNVKMTECSTDQNNAVKYMNDNINLFAHANDDKLAIVAAEDLDGTYFGFSTVEGGVFTISFTNVEGREFEFVDLEANKAVKVAEGNTYTFTAAPNTVADHRFKLVGIKNMPTAVDNLNAAKNQTGIYTIMGQYVGEMNLWNTLPAGVYVVNGEKRVK